MEQSIFVNSMLFEKENILIIKMGAIHKFEKDLLHHSDVFKSNSFV